MAVTCHLQQKTGAGMSSATCCYWDKDNDGADLRTATAPFKRPSTLCHLSSPHLRGLSHSSVQWRSRINHTAISAHRDAGHFSVNFDNTGLDEKVGTDAIEASVTVYFVAL